MKKNVKIASLIAIPILAIGIGGGIAYAQTTNGSDTAGMNQTSLPELPQGFRQWKKQSAPDSDSGSATLPNGTDGTTIDDSAITPEFGPGGMFGNQQPPEGFGVEGWNDGETTLTPPDGRAGCGMGRRGGLNRGGRFAPFGFGSDAGKTDQGSASAMPENGSGFGGRGSGRGECGGGTMTDTDSTAPGSGRGAPLGTGTVPGRPGIPTPEVTPDTNDSTTDL